ncbi:MAG TPA: hypothetical protein VK590_08740 [Saprospiraceae bacterium]|nr:hypothetical protein [Saprospiraceae bacterium]
MKRIYFDTQFTGLHKDKSLISICFIADTGEEFYGEFTDFNPNSVTNWIEINVMSKLFLNPKNQSLSLTKMHVKGNKSEIQQAISEWLSQFNATINKDEFIAPFIQIWGDSPSWDWVLFTGLFEDCLPLQIIPYPLDVTTLIFIKDLDINAKRIDLIEGSKILGHYIPNNALSETYVIRLLVEKILR